MPGVDDLTTEEVRDALRLLGADEAVIGAASRRVLREQLATPGRVTDLLDLAPDGAERVFRDLAIDGAASVEDMLGRGWAGHGILPPPLDWLQKRALVILGTEGLVHACDAARRGFTTLTLNIPDPLPIDDVPLLIEDAMTVVTAPNEAALAKALGVRGAALRAVSATVAVSDRPPIVVQAALTSAGAVSTRPRASGSLDDHESGPGPTALPLPGVATDVVGPRAIRAVIQEALADRRQLRLEYFASSRGGQATERVVDPWAFEDDLLRGWCHLRSDERTFALDRIGHARLLGTSREHEPAEGA